MMSGLSAFQEAHKKAAAELKILSQLAREKRMSDFNEPAYPVQGLKYDDRLGGQLFHGLTIRQTAVLMMAAEMAGCPDNYRFEDIPDLAISLADAVLKREAETRGRSGE